MIKKYSMDNCSSKKVPIAFGYKITADPTEESINQKVYRGVIDSLMYMAISRLDIIFAMGWCASYQADPKVSHLNSVKQIFKYLKRRKNWVFSTHQGTDLVCKPLQNHISWDAD